MIRSLSSPLDHHFNALHETLSRVASGQGDGATAADAPWGVGAPERTPASPSDSIAPQVADAYKFRRRRALIFGDDADLLAEPAWDLMLDLYDADSRGQTVSVSSAAIGACVATSTALRWMDRMRQRGLLAYHDDPFDRRRRFVSLTDKGKDVLQRCFQQ